MRTFATSVGLSAVLALSALAGGTAQAQQYGYGYQNAPAGSYQQSCTNISTRGAVLTASCTTYNGQRVRSSLAFASCTGTDIGNINGQLTCIRNGNGYGNQSAPAGSYQQSCTNIRTRGAVLTANCATYNGQRVRSSLAFASCRGTDIGNIDGQLTCVRNGNGYGRGRGHRGQGDGGRYNNGYNNGALPSGSYQQSCSNASMNGTTLTATCQAANGGTYTSYLDVTQCRPTDDIGNLNGQLRCIYRQ